MLPKTDIRFALVVALSENNVIGNNGKLPWHLPADLKFFKKLTLEHPLIMGRKTFASLPKPLPRRVHIVLTKNKELRSRNKEVIFVFSWDEALQKAVDIAKTNQKQQAFIIGGEQIFRQVLENNFVSEAFLTRVHTRTNGNAFFPLELITGNSAWKLRSIKHRFPDKKNPYAMQFQKWEKEF